MTETRRKIRTYGGYFQTFMDVLWTRKLDERDIMQTNNHKVEDYDIVLDTKYSKEGTEQRAQFEEEAKAFYASQILLQARKEAKVTQSELAHRVGTTKSYISKIENGVVEHGVGLFFRIINSLGFNIDISRPLGL